MINVIIVMKNNKIKVSVSLVVKQHVAVAVMHLCHLAQYNVHYSDGLRRGSQSIMHLRLT